MSSKLTITAHCLVKNEERFVWYSVMSVLPYVDKLLLWDTGSTDGTLDIISEIMKEDSHKKIEFKKYGEVTKDTFTQVRQEMLDATKTDWFIVVDGDEIWWQDSIKKVVETIQTKGNELESIVVPTINLVGDIYHYQEQAAGKYLLAGHRGHYNLRGVNRKIPGLHSFGPHGTWGWVDGNNKMIQDREKRKILFIDAPYLHATFLPRAAERQQEQDVPKRAKKLKHELGISFPLDFYYPEILFLPRPKIVPSVWVKMTDAYRRRALLETPLRKIKRRIFKDKIGY